jgi:hypothetical protein
MMTCVAEQSPKTDTASYVSHAVAWKKRLPSSRRLANRTRRIEGGAINDVFDTTAITQPFGFELAFCPSPTPRPLSRLHTAASAERAVADALGAVCDALQIDGPSLRNWCCGDLPARIRFFARARGGKGSGKRQTTGGIIELQGNAQGLPHEIGHAIDFNLGRSITHWWSNGATWRAACRRAPRLMTHWRIMDDVCGRRHSRSGVDDYYSSPHEIFARAFEYFVATHAAPRRWATHAKRRFLNEGWGEIDELEGLSRCIARNILPAVAKPFVVPPLVLENERRMQEGWAKLAARNQPIETRS